MKTTRHKSTPTEVLDLLRSQLADAEAALHAIRTGEVDAVVVAGQKGPQVFTLHGAEHAYRVLIESMNEGALTLTPDKTILYANHCFAQMVHGPLEQVIGSSLLRFLSSTDRVRLRTLMKRTRKSGSKIQVLLKTCAGSQLPVQISIRPLARNDFNRATVSMVVTDQTEARRTEEMLRALSHHIVQAQEAERGRVALELHDHITQLLCAILIRSKTLAAKLSTGNPTTRKEALKLSEMLGETAEEVERISRGLRPGVLELMGLVAVLRDTSADFTERTGVPHKLDCAQLTSRLSADIELALYRILQEALKNVEKHASARHVMVRLTKRSNIVQLVIADDGNGFDSERPLGGKIQKSGLGLIAMRERATYVGGTLKVKSNCRSGTEIEIRIPLPPKNE